LAGDDPTLIKFGPKGTDPKPEGCVFHVSCFTCTALCIGCCRPFCSFYRCVSSL